MKADRLLSILSWLQTNVRVTARELASKLEVSERTIHRDMEALGMAGIPVVADRGYQGGWSLPDGYRSRLTGLTGEEISALLLLGSSSVVKDLGLTAGVQGAFRKLLSALPASVRRNAEITRQRIHIDGAGWRSTGPFSEASAVRQRYLELVQQAVWEERKLRIRYRAVDSDSDKERIVCPLGLVAKQSVWYMIVSIEDEIRTYRISRLTAVRPMEETFERPETFDLAACWERSTERFQAALPRYPATVRVAASHWPRFRQERYVFPQNDKLLDDGWVEAEVEFHTLESACSIVLGYGRCVAAVAPEDLRQAVKEELDAAAALYGDIKKEAVPSVI